MTHRVTNQPPPLVDYDLYRTDPVLPGAVESFGGGWGHDQLEKFGTRIGTAEVFGWGEAANRHTPTLQTHDRYGHRIDEVEYHPSYHRLMDLSVSAGLHSLQDEPEAPDGRQVVRAALFSLMAQVESGHGCPISMTSSVLPSLAAQPQLDAVWRPRVLTRSYDPRFMAADAKTGALLGMGMTEKQGGSDVRANTTTAVAVGGGGPAGEYRLTGHKWFLSAPMCDAFLVLAQAPGGLSCFLLPRFTPDGARNPLRLIRLKDKLGNRSNASSEVEFDDTAAWLVGDEGDGVRTIIEMVNGTRLDCVIGSVGLMRQAVAQAGWHASHRRAFGSLLADKPAMQNVLADLEIEIEAATLIMTRLAAAFDAAGDDADEAIFKRIATPVAKYWVTKRCTPVVREALECLGGNGYVEESILPRLFRESPLNAVWEGSGNIIALDVLRSAAREPATIDAFRVELTGLTPELDEVAESLPRLFDDPLAERNARRVTERMGIAWAAALLHRHGDPAVAEAFTKSRVGGDHGALFGTLPDGVDVGRLAAAAVPSL